MLVLCIVSPLSVEDIVRELAGSPIAAHGHGLPSTAAWAGVAGSIMGPFACVAAAAPFT
ncbi:unnamed protein product [Strongylus vulgaris]|uniref:Uncharacterized protein n=1 Tax=Strongylus vulgaris TaxID=40348 RepID=A0A3P7KS48_STRVU|nr:unnamed protein product [Strongylus vulgaris]